MDIVIEQVPEDPPEQPPLVQEDPTTLQPEEAPPEPLPKRRGRPTGSKNKPKIIEQVPEQPIVLNEPPPEEPPLDEPPPKKPPRKPRAGKAQVQAALPYQMPTEAPKPQTPLQVAASMLEILRLEQAERAHRKGQMYKSWVK